MNWRICHGAFDRDTSLAIPVILALLLEMKGYDMDFRLPWGLPHSSDYDLEELFTWIDGICTQGQDIGGTEKLLKDISPFQLLNQFYEREIHKTGVPKYFSFARTPVFMY